MNEGLKEKKAEKAPRLVLFSPDMVFCVSLRMLYQDRFDIACTTDPEMLVTMVKSLRPQVVIADCLPTAAMRQKFSAIRREYPEIKVIFLYFSARPDPMLAEYLRQSGDVAFKKPVDLDEVTETIRKLVAGAQVSQLTVLRSSDLTAA